MINTTTLQGPYVFISYSRIEEAFAKRLEQDLRAHGIWVWRDETNINPGSPDWEVAIRDAISHAYAVVLIASPSVIQSLYIKGELNLAKRYHPNRIYPVWIDGTDWSDCVPIDFINTEYIDLRRGSYATGLNTLVKVLREAREQLSLNTATPQAPMPGGSPTPMQDRLAPTYSAGPGGQLSVPNTGVDSKSGQHPYTPSNPFVSPSPQPRRRRLSAGKTVLLIVLVLLTVGAGGALYVRTAPLSGQSHPHASLTTPAPQVKATPSTQTPQALYAQITQGIPALDDHLSTNDTNNWTVTTPADGNFSCAFSGGVYHVSAPYTPCLAQATNFGDLAYQVQMTIVNGEFGGMVFRVDRSQTKYYTFFIYTKGTYKLRISVDNTGNNDYDLGKGSSAFIKTGLNQANLLTVIARGSSIYLYINQQYITNASDTTYRAGQIGVFGGYSSGAPADVIFSRAQVWNASKTSL
jgi:hypothetical protein